MSGYPGGDDFYGSPCLSGGGLAINNSFRVQYGSQLGGGVVVDPTAMVSQRAESTATKRSLAELQQQQQQQRAFLLRSVKQRSHQTSPISPLSPVSPEISTASSASSVRNQAFAAPGASLPPRQPNLFGGAHLPPNLALISGASNLRHGHEAEPELSTHCKMRNRLQELERQLLDDDDDEEEEDTSHEEGDCSAASAITNSEWSETMQSLVSPPPAVVLFPPPQQQQQKPLSPSPTTSSSSSSSNSSCSTNNTPASATKQQLLDAASAISEGNIESATAILTALQQQISTTTMSRPGGSTCCTTPEQRLTAYLVRALVSRISPSSDTCFPVAELCGSEHAMGTQMLYEASPCFKLGFMAANQIILEATRNQGGKKIHVIDFDIGQGSQYMTLIHALGDRQSAKPLPAVRITAVNDPTAPSLVSIPAVGERLTKLAERVGVSLRFGVVCRKAADLTREALGCEDEGGEESLAVNFAFRLSRMADESVSTANPRDELLRCVKRLGPRVVTVVEQEMNGNTAPFLTRFNEVESYYGAAFESLEATMGGEMSKERRAVEECLARKAANCVAREGRERVERCEVLGKWRARLSMAGFESRPLPPRLADSMRVRLNSVRPNPGFFVKEDNGGVCLGWKGRVLTVASAWR